MERLRERNEFLEAQARQDSKIIAMRLDEYRALHKRADHLATQVTSLSEAFAVERDALVKIAHAAREVLDVLEGEGRAESGVANRLRDALAKWEAK